MKISGDTTGQDANPRLVMQPSRPRCANQAPDTTRSKVPAS